MPIRAPLVLGTPVLCVLVLCAVILAPADTAAADETHPCPPEPPACRIEVIPACCTCVEREVVVPAVTRRVCTPIYESVEVPVLVERATPRYEEIDVPTYGWRYVPVYHEVCRPVWRTRQVPVYQDVITPVTMSRFDPFCCTCDEILLFETCRRVPIGCEPRTELAGYRTHHVPGGMRKERYVTGTTKKKVQVGLTFSVEQTGTRIERRLKGYRTKEIVVVPARTEVVVQRVTIPSRRVTVVRTGHTHAAPLPGTHEVLTETEFRAEVRCLHGMRTNPGGA